MQTNCWTGKSPLVWIGIGLLLVWSCILLFGILACCWALTYNPDDYLPRYQHHHGSHYHRYYRDAASSDDSGSQHNQAVSNQVTNNPQPQKSADERIADLTFWLVVVGAVNALVYWLQWGLSRSTARRQLRAYVCLVFGKDEEVADPTNRQFNMVIKNCGQTPARHLISFVGWNVFNGENAPWPEDVDMEGNEVDMGGSRATLGSGEPTTLQSDVSKLQNPAGFLHALERANRKECTLYIIGRITYVDVFDRPQFTKYCFTHVAGKALGHTVVCGFHNETS